MTVDTGVFVSEQQLNTREHEIELWHTALTQLSEEHDSQLKQLKSELSEVQNSTSWKITASIRYLGTVARRVRSGLRKIFR